MNSTELKREWQDVCEQVRHYEGINASQVNAFFSRLQPQAMSDDFLMITADNDFIKTWIEIHYMVYIQQALKDLHDRDFTVVIEVDLNQQPEPLKESGTENQIIQQTEESSRQALSESSTTTSPEKPDESRLEREEESMGAENSLETTSTLTFENFVIGESNRMAYSMAVAVAEEPGRPMLNPLFIYGKSGLGKTHLMRAIQHYLKETRPELKTVYVDSADFLSEYVDSQLEHDKNKSSYKNFKNKYQSADVLLIDDIQYFQGKTQTLDIVFQIFNRLIDEGRQVVLSADRAPKNITMDERYKSRFNSGGTFDIQPPEVETKLGIVKSFVEEYKRTSNTASINLSPEVERYIAENSSSNIRELKSAVTKVIYSFSSSNLEEVTIQDVTDLLENHFSGGTMRKPTIGEIQKQVELYYNISHADLVGQKRSRKIVYARQVAIYLSRTMLDMPYQHIANDFGGRDHTTIMYSITNVEEKLKENRDLREEIENIKKRIREQ